jgi:membrane associated rhomboid family serine protease
VLIPISDENEEGYRNWYHHPVHYFFIAACCVVFIYETYLLVQHGDAALQAFADRWSFDPREYLGTGFLTLQPARKFSVLMKCLAQWRNLGLVKMLASAFLHASPMHLLGNMYILWILGDNVEYAMGSVRYFVFFLLVSLLSEMGRVLLSSGGDFMPAIGASGAIMAVAGAYWMYFPKAEINFFYVFFPWWGVFSIRARIVLAFMFLSDAATTWYEYSHHHYSDVAVGAHASGFIAGMLLAFPFDDRPELYQPQALPFKRQSVFKPKPKPTDDYWGGI